MVAVNGTLLFIYTLYGYFLPSRLTFPSTFVKQECRSRRAILQCDNAGFTSFAPNGKKKNMHMLALYWVKLFNPFIPSGLFCLNSLDRSISDRRDVWLLLLLLLLLLLPCFIEISVAKVNSVDPDQTPQNVASDPLGLHR